MTLRLTAALCLGAALLTAAPVLAGAQNRTAPPAASLDQIAQDFVRLTLEAGEREPGYVDAYYGPKAWATAAKAAPRSVPQLRAEADRLAAALAAIDGKALSPDLVRRKAFLGGQLTAAQTRLAMLGGVKFSFQDEAEGLFGVRPALKPLTSYDPVLTQIETLLPGDGDLAARADAFQAKYVIPADGLEPVMRAAIAACKAKTAAHIALPKDERFDLEFVKDKPWSGYNWYQGGAHSLIQINTDLPVYISRALDLGCHEGYPGHHVLNALLEQKLTKARGWVEFSVYPLFSPQSLIAEGSANYGIALAFPGAEKVAFERETLYPLAGLDPASAQAHDAFTKAKADLAGAEYTIADDYLAGRIDRAQAVALQRKYGLMSQARAEQRMKFVDTYRSYVINYGLGQDRVREHVERAGASVEARWARMEAVISQPTTPADLAR